MKRPHIMVIDPGVFKPELEALNHLIHLSNLPVTYHLPAMHGMESLKSDTEGINGIVIFGSASSVNERKEWQKALEDHLRPLIEQGIPTFGICYGHQMLAHMFGGKVDYLFSDRRTLLGFRQVNLQADPLWNSEELKGNVCVSHNEVVISVPETMQVLGSSSEVKTDFLKHQKLPVWSSQFHPEATPRFLTARGYVGAKEECHQFGHNLLGLFLKFVERK